MIISQLKHIECGMFHHAERWWWIVEWDSSGVSRPTERALGLQYHSPW